MSLEQATLDWLKIAKDKNQITASTVAVKIAYQAKFGRKDGKPVIEGKIILKAAGAKPRLFVRETAADPDELAAKMTGALQNLRGDDLLKEQ